MDDSDIGVVMRFWGKNPALKPPQVIKAMRGDPRVRKALYPNLLTTWRSRYGSRYGLDKVCRACGQDLPEVVK